MTTSTARTIEAALLDRMLYIRVTGLATMHNCSALSDLCHSLLDADCDAVMFDLKRCTGMDSTFMGVMAGLGLRKPGPECPVMVVNADEHARKLMSGLGLDHIVRVLDEPVEPPVVETHQLRDDWASVQDKIAFIKQAHEHLVAINSRN
jgi:hypothetical protein